MITFQVIPTKSGYMAALHSPEGGIHDAQNGETLEEALAPLHSRVLEAHPEHADVPILFFTGPDKDPKPFDPTGPKIVVHRRTGDYHAHIEGNLGMWGCDKTPEGAVKSLVRNWTESEGMPIVYSKTMSERHYTWARNFAAQAAVATDLLGSGHYPSIKPPSCGD